jgi:signal transduction histidine kinase
MRIGEGDTPELVKVAIYRVVQEAFNNISKHSSATNVEASLEHSNNALELIISDNGCGFEPKEAQCGYDGTTGLGLRNMRERVEATGGTFDLESTPGNGVAVRAKWADEEPDSNQ